MLGSGSVAEGTGLAEVEFPARVELEVTLEESSFGPVSDGPDLLLTSRFVPEESGTFHERPAGVLST